MGWGVQYRRGRARFSRPPRASLRRSAAGCDWLLASRARPVPRATAAPGKVPGRTRRAQVPPGPRGGAAPAGPEPAPGRGGGARVQLGRGRGERRGGGCHRRGRHPQAGSGSRAGGGERGGRGLLETPFRCCRFAVGRWDPDRDPWFPHARPRVTRPPAGPHHRLKIPCGDSWCQCGWSRRAGAPGRLPESPPATGWEGLAGSGTMALPVTSSWYWKLGRVLLSVRPLVCLLAGSTGLSLWRRNRTPEIQRAAGCWRAAR